MKKDSAVAAPCIAIDGMPSIAADGITVHPVPLLRATTASFAAYGRFVEDFDSEQVIIETWPAPGWRAVEAGTGNEGGVTAGLFEFERRGGLMIARNHAVDGHYITGWFNDPAHATAQDVAVDHSRVLVREANYHPDGGQVFFPHQKTPFVILLAPPGDDLQPEQFVAFHCDGSVGVQIYPNIWHQPVFPLATKATFKGKQGRVHACIACDTVKEFGCYLSVPLAERL